jgi:hypothetical protein
MVDREGWNITLLAIESMLVGQPIMSADEAKSTQQIMVSRNHQERLRSSSLLPPRQNISTSRRQIASTIGVFGGCAASQPDLTAERKFQGALQQVPSTVQSLSRVLENPKAERSILMDTSLSPSTESQLVDSHQVRPRFETRDRMTSNRISSESSNKGKVRGWANA